MIGSLTAIYGPMFAGKTTRLQKLVGEAISNGKNVLVINHSTDMRYSSECYCVSHDGVRVPAIKVSNLGDIESSTIESANFIAIDEGQFFTDLVTMADQWANVGKEVIVATLDSTYERKPFGKVCELLAVAEHVIKLQANCDGCKINKASYTWRKIHSNEICLVGGAESYEPLCRRCFYIRSQNLHENDLDIQTELVQGNTQKDDIEDHLSTKDNSNTKSEISEDLHDINVQVTPLKLKDENIGGKQIPKKGKFVNDQCLENQEIEIKA